MKTLSETVAAQPVAFIATKDGTECPFVHLNNDLPEIGKFLAYAMMERDLASAKELFLETQNHLENATIFGAIFSESVMAYCRPFKPGNQRSITNKVLDWIDAKLNDEHQSLIAHFKTMKIEDLYQHSIDPKNIDGSVRKFFLEYPFE